MMGAPRGAMGMLGSDDWSSAPNPLATQMKSYAYKLWLPIPHAAGEDISDSLKPEQIETTKEVISDLLDADSAAFLQRIHGQGGYKVVNTNKRLPDGTTIQNLNLFMERRLLEYDKTAMTVEQMRVTLLSAMVPALDVKKWTMKSQMWPIIVKLAQGVLIEPRPEVLAAPCKWYSKVQLKKFLQSLGVEPTEEIKWREAFSTPETLCQVYADMFTSKISDAAYSNAVSRGAKAEGMKRIQQAKRDGLRNAGGSMPIGGVNNYYGNYNGNDDYEPPKRKAKATKKTTKKSKTK